MADYGEPTIRQRGDGKRFKSRTRFFVEPQLMRVRIAIRIEEPIKGKPYGEFVVLRRGKRSRFWQTDDRRRFKISTEDFEEFNDLMDESGLWTYERQAWRDEDGEDYLCIDGVYLYVERQAGGTYYTASGNGSCEVPPEVRAVIYKAMKMSGGPHFHF